MPTHFFPLCNYLNCRFHSNKQEYCIFCLKKKLIVPNNNSNAQHRSSRANLVILINFSGL